MTYNIMEDDTLDIFDDIIEENSDSSSLKSELEDSKKEIEKLKKQLEKSKKTTDTSKIQNDLEKAKETISTYKSQVAQYNKAVEKLKEELVKLKTQNHNLTEELEVYSTNFINKHRQGYTIYMLDPFYKNEILNDIKKVKKNSINDIMENIFEEIAINVEKDVLPKNIILSDENYNSIIDYFIEIEQEPDEKCLVINKNYKLEFYISETIKNKIKII